MGVTMCPTQAYTIPYGRLNNLSYTVFNSYIDSLHYSLATMDAISATPADEPNFD